MYEIFKDITFSGAHMLRGYHGKCESLHGHNWKVRAFMIAEQLDELGMVVDFKALKKAMKEICERLDHRMLNDVPPFDEVNPSAENIAKYFFDELAAKANDGRACVSQVSIWESDGSCASYRP